MELKMQMYKPNNIPTDSQLLKGIGASAWFHISEEETNFRIKRFSEEGKLECSRIFSINNTDFNIHSPFQFTYTSHCKKCTIIQNNNTYIFKTNDYEY